MLSYHIISPIQFYSFFPSRQWFQWYCRFYLGRRSTDDERQIKRGLGVCGPKGRFRNQLIGRCARNGKKFDDYTVSPVIRQALQHWGYQLTKKDADAYVRKKKIAKVAIEKIKKNKLCVRVCESVRVCE